MAKLIDMGFKPSFWIEVSSKQDKNKIEYPSINLFEKVPSELMKKDIGETLHLEVVVKITRKGIDESRGKKTENMNLEIHKLGIKDDKSLNDRVAKLASKKRS